MKKTIYITMCLPFISHAANLFDSYESCYQALSNRLFHSDGHELEPFSMEESEGVFYGWSGFDSGRQRSVELQDGQLTIDSKRLPTNFVKPFPRETIDIGDLGLGAKVYFKDNWVCVEGSPPSASGTAVRHQSVYLIRTGNNPMGWKLPSLFASCIAVRVNGGLPDFDSIRYFYQKGKDQPSGVDFTEYKIKNGSFLEVGNKRRAVFIDCGNVYKFRFE
ncbi:MULTISPECIES: hypothetical protein [Plesiomonas]|uniref:hypothetical protein n=1 Tax=Plesiomonas TaxID=702 RepID=UPI0007ECB435|nr:MULTISPECIES: hypothetical protein [Plesiomonas]KAB7674140.1 hypothetical protein GBN23_14310 [Plesiomonas shigelloides]KAB7687825.1 hypothetical protein GBN28_10340 [Plesiomonas shigelloides]MCE5163254.1 hypothetical protein [Plesiomonas sp. PI-19]MCQ8858182.1 hypothetical protein [Plesiomonas shigelloides]SBT61470.1 Uncharacterised protein [Plesiomonas shigelloides]